MFASQSFYDAAFDDLATKGIRVAVCSSEPANYAGIAAVKLAEATLASGDYTKGAATPDGRKVTIAAKNGVTATGTGTPAYLAIHDNTSELLRTTPATLDSGGDIQSLVPGVKVDIGSWEITIAGPKPVTP